MHEMTLAINIVKIACKTANQNGADKINSIEVEVGKLAGVLEDSLAFCFEAARNNSIAKDAQLKILTIPGKAHCIACDDSFDTDTFFTLCPECDGIAIDIIQGKDLRIKSINVD